MKEYIELATKHLFENSYTFEYWQVYLYWISVVLIFVIDNMLRHSYNKKLKIEHDLHKSEIEAELHKSQAEVQRLENKIVWFTMRDGGEGSVMDIKDYHVKVNTISYGEGTSVDLGWEYTINTNFPKLKE